MSRPATGLLKVKQEPDEPEPDTDPIEVPPSVVLDKLEALVQRGRVVLRFKPPKGEGWGIIGKVDDAWCTFRIEGDGASKFVDDTLWATPSRDEWAESEVEWLERLRKEADHFPCSDSAQPSGLRPRLCRRAVFAYHKREYAKTHKPVAKAPIASNAPVAGKATVPKQPVGKAPVGKSPVVTKQPAVAKQAIGKQPAISKQPAIAKTPAKAPELQVAVNEDAIGDDDDEELSKEEQEYDNFLQKVQAVLKARPGQAFQQFLQAISEDSADPEVAQRMLQGHPPLVAEYRRVVLKEVPKAENSGFREFMSAVKARLMQRGQKDKYAQFLRTVAGQDLSNNSAIVSILHGNADLIQHYWRVRKASQESGKLMPVKPKQPGGPPPAHLLASKAAAAQAEAAKRERPVPKPVNIDKEVMEPLRNSGGDSLAQLVRLIRPSGALASERLEMVKYIKAQKTEEGALRQLFILRGAPGTGKSTWAMEQLRLMAGVAEEDEAAARRTHICCPDDFLVVAADDGKSTFDPNANPAKIEMAHGKNQARAELAADLGIQPLYVDSSNIELWEMTEYVKLGQKHGYDVSIVSPMEILLSEVSVDALVSRNEARPQERKIVPREQIEELLERFEALPEEGDPLAAILSAERKGGRVVAFNPPPGLAAAASRNGTPGSQGIKRQLSGNAQIPAGKRPATQAAQIAKSKPGAPPRPAVAKTPAKAPAAISSPPAEGDGFDDDALSAMPAPLASPTSESGRSTEAAVASSLLASLRKRF